MIDMNEMFEGFASDKQTTNREDCLDTLLQNKDVRDFIIENDLSQEEALDAVNVFIEYLSDTKLNSNGERESVSMPGYKLVLTYENKKVSKKYYRLKPVSKVDQNLKLYSLPPTLKDAKLEDFSLISKERMQAFQYAKKFIDTFNKNSELKGMYIFGAYRSGKTYLASAIANEIAKKGYKVIVSYYPSLASELKRINSREISGSFSDVVEELKNCDLLVLDDFAGMKVSSQIRDEAIGVILNHRILFQKPVIFTSNAMIKDLASSILSWDDSEMEKFNSLRVVERIKDMTETFNFYDKYEDLRSKQ